MKHGVTESMCTAQVLPVMEIPGLGNMAAKTLCDDWKIKTQGDKKLEEAKKIVYLKGFNEGVMVVGNYTGRKVTITSRAIYCNLECHEGGVFNLVVSYRCVTSK